MVEAGTHLDLPEEASRGAGDRHALRLGKEALLVVTLVLAGFLLAVARPEALGGNLNFVLVVGTSMEPTMQDGDLVVASKKLEYEIDDVIAYRIPEGEAGAGALVIHRVVGGSAENGYRTRGDNRRNEDPWLPTPRDIIGKSVVKLPNAGLLVERLRTPVGLAFFAGSVMFVLVVAAAGARPREEDEEDEENEEDDLADDEGPPGDQALLAKPSSAPTAPPAPPEPVGSAPPAPHPQAMTVAPAPPRPTAEQAPAPQARVAATAPLPAQAAPPPAAPPAAPEIPSPVSTPRIDSGDAGETERPLVTPRLLVLALVGVLAVAAFAALKLYSPFTAPEQARAAPSAKSAPAPSPRAKAARAPRSNDRPAETRPPDFVVPGAPRESTAEMTLPARARIVARRVATLPPTGPNVRWWLYQHQWIVAGAEFGWHRGAEALRLLVAADRVVQRRWGIGLRNEAVARAALAEVRAARARARRG